MIESISKNDLTNLKTTIDSRFSKLEKNVEKIHNEFKLKLFEGIIDNINGDEVNNNPNESLDLNYAKETGQNNYQSKRATYEVYYYSFENSFQISVLFINHSLTIVYNPDFWDTVLFLWLYSFFSNVIRKELLQ